MVFAGMGIQIHVHLKNTQKEEGEEQEWVDTHGLTPVALKIAIPTGVDLYLFSPEIRHIAL